MPAITQYSLARLLVGNMCDIYLSSAALELKSYILWAISETEDSRVAH